MDLTCLRTRTGRFAEVDRWKYEGDVSWTGVVHSLFHSMSLNRLLELTQVDLI